MARYIPVRSGGGASRLRLLGVPTTTKAKMSQGMKGRINARSVCGRKDIPSG